MFREVHQVEVLKPRRRHPALLKLTAERANRKSSLALTAGAKEVGPTFQLAVARPARLPIRDRARNLLKVLFRTFSVPPVPTTS